MGLFSSKKQEEYAIYNDRYDSFTDHMVLVEGSLIP